MLVGARDDEPRSVAVVFPGQSSDPRDSTWTNCVTGPRKGYGLGAILSRTDKSWTCPHTAIRLASRPISRAGARDVRPRSSSCGGDYNRL